MSNEITAGQIADRIKKNGSSGTYHAGSEDTAVTGVVTTYTPTLDVLRRAVQGGKNMIVSREGPFWARKPDKLAGNPTYIYKRDFIARNKLVVFQLRDNPRGREGVDTQLRALAVRLGWDKYHIVDPASAAPPYGPDNVFFRLPETSLEALARRIQQSLKICAARVIGDPRTKVSKVALTHGRTVVPNLQKVLREPGVDAVIIGEPVEWTGSPYFQDVIASGQKKGMIALGLEASEEPGTQETTAWLKSFITEIPIEWIPAGEPFSVLKHE